MPTSKEPHTHKTKYVRKKNYGLRVKHSSQSHLHLPKGVKQMNPIVLDSPVINNDTSITSKSLLDDRELVQTGMKKRGLTSADMRKLIKEIRNGKKN